MPYTLQAGEIRFKNQSTSNPKYQNTINILTNQQAAQVTNDYLEQLEDKKQQAVTAVESVGSRYTTAYNNCVQATNNANSALSYIAPVFSTSAVYKAGDLVIYNGDIYCRKTDATTSESWISSNWVKTSISNEVQQLTDNLALAQTSQPTSDYNRIWFPMTENEVSIATEADVEAVAGMIAQEYDSTKTYSIGDYCRYNNQLYRCNTNITTAEAWTIGHWTAGAIGGELNALKSARWDENGKNTIHIQRMFRFAVSKYANVGQCVAYTGHSLLFGAPSRSNTVQRIIETDLEGNILTGRDVTFTHTEGTLDASYYIGHMNDFCFHNGDIYTIGRDHTIVRIKYADLSCNVEEDVFPLEVSEYSYYGAYGISSWNGDLYVNTVINNNTYNPVVFKVNLETRTLERVCQYAEPTVYNGLHAVKQGFEIHDGYGYSIYNYDNQILKIDLKTGEVVKVFQFGLGDGYYPIGEVENVVFIGGQMYMTTVLWINSPFWTQTIGQFFKTDVGGIVTPSSDNGQSDQTYGALYVDGTSTLNNPDGTVSRPFNSIEEACHVYIYRHRFTNIDETSFAVVNAQGLEGQYFYMQNVSVTANLGNAELSGIQLRGCRGMLRNFVAADARLFYSDLFLTNCEITTLTQAQACTLNVNGTIGAVTQLERSILNFFGYNHPLDTTFTLTEAGLNTCEIHGAGRGLNIVGTTIPIKSGTTACTITLPENSITAAKLYAARNVGMTVRAAVGVTDIAAATQYIVEWRLTMDHMAIIRSGGDPGWVHTAFVVPSTTKGSLIVCRIACKVMLTQIRFSVTEFYRADTGADITDANISIFDINLLSSGRDLI